MIENDKNKVLFLLFLDPQTKQFYSYSTTKRILIHQQPPINIKKEIMKQIDDLNVALANNNNNQSIEINNFQRRSIPLNYIVQAKFILPVYITQQPFPSSMLEDIRFNQNGFLVKDQLISKISSKIYLLSLLSQLKPSSKQINEYISIDIKLITSQQDSIIDKELIKFLEQQIELFYNNMVFNYKQIFKVRFKNQYMYGNDALLKFLHVRECLKNGLILELEIIQAEVYNREQNMKFMFYRDLNQINNGQFAAFPWQNILRKGSLINFLIWYQPQNEFIKQKKKNKKSSIKKQQQQQYCYKKYKYKQNKINKINKQSRYLWKYKIKQFILNRRKQIYNKYINIQQNIIYSGQCNYLFLLTIQSLQLIESLLIINNYQEIKNTHKTFLKFTMKENIITDNITNDENKGQKLQSAQNNFIQFGQLQKQGLYVLSPYMLSIQMQFIYNSQCIYKEESNPVLISNNIYINQNIQWIPICKIMMEVTIIFKIRVFAKQGNSVLCGFGALKIFDQWGYILQGQHEIEILPINLYDVNKIGCINKLITNNSNNKVNLTIKLPIFKQPMIWTLYDPICLKMLGYLPQIDKIEKVSNSSQNIQELNKLLKSNALQILQYTSQQKQILRKYKKIYRNCGNKLINFLYSINWCDSKQVTQAYQTIQQWVVPQPIQALFLLNPRISDEKVRYWAAKIIQTMQDYEIILYSNQIIQALVSFETIDNPLINLIIQKSCMMPYMIGVEYFWQFRNRINQSLIGSRFRMYLQSLVMCSPIRRQLVNGLRVNNILVSFNNRLVTLTQNMNIRQRNKKFKSLIQQLQKELNEINKNGFNFPIRMQNTFKHIITQKCIIFDSKKLPFALTCITNKSSTSSTSTSIINPYRVMFKYGDDIKQDHLTLQIFNIFNKLWCNAGYDFKMNIYRVLSTNNQTGFIQLVQNAYNNSKIHKQYGKGMIQAFDQQSTVLFLKDQNPNEIDFLHAKENYIRSSAGYLVATYVMGIGDRHSGNIMVQKNGKFFHIDFGHILGHFKSKFNIKRQRTQFIFTSQFASVIGKLDGKDFIHFEELCSKAYNILRQNLNLIVNLLIMMVSAGIQHLTKLTDINYVIRMLDQQLSDKQASDKMIKLIRQTLNSQKSRQLDNAFHEANRDG